MNLSAWFSVIVGILIIAQWAFFLAAGAVPELQTEPWRISFHLTAELVTAACLIVAGLALFQGKSWAKCLALFAAGMLAYTVIASPGYFAQQGQWPFVGMFAILLILDVVNLWRMR